jgi:hypothetical protein
MRKDQKLKAKRKSNRDKSKPASKGSLRKENTAIEVARIVKPRRWRALPASGAVAALIADRDDRDHELAERIARPVEWRRGSKAHVENDLGGVRSEKRVRVTVTLEEDLIRLAQSFTDTQEISAVIRIALTELVDRNMNSRLTALGRKEPDSNRVPRRRLPGK